MYVHSISIRNRLLIEFVWLNCSEENERERERALTAVLLGATFGCIVLTGTDKLSEKNEPFYSR